MGLGHIVLLSVRIDMFYKNNKTRKLPTSGLFCKDASHTYNYILDTYKHVLIIFYHNI